ncbi:MAG: HDIG domain-containing protein [Chloroflexi bacterium]|nr:HDIG domain-containing protein [Chloroflexota bacterium]
MIARRASLAAAFTRRDAVRLTISASVLIAVLAGILSLDILPSGFAADVGDPAPNDLTAPRTLVFSSAIQTEQRREDARKSVVPQYDYTSSRGQASAAQQLAVLDTSLAPVDAAFEALLTDDARRTALLAALPTLSIEAKVTLTGLDKVGWTALRGEMVRVFEQAQRQEVRDTELTTSRAGLDDRLASRFGSTERALAGEIMSPHLVANSSYDEAATEATRNQAAAAIQPIEFTIRKGELIVRKGQRLEATDLEKMQALGLLDPRPDVAKFGGWLLLAALLVGVLLAWVWRFRREFWHRNNALLLVGLLLVAATAAISVTGGRSILPFFVPTAAVALLLAVLLDGSAAVIVTIVMAVVASAVSGSVELGAYTLLGGVVGVITVRRGERISNFVQAALAMALTNVVVVTVFTLLGERDPIGVLQLYGASLAAATGAAVAAVGTFAALGNVFGITTSFQLLELATPSQPLLRRLLLETAGTYHHSLMVGNLAERAAEAVGANPLVARVAAYYHDIGKLANPLAFIENQGAAGNIHDELSPERSAAVLKAHVANGIDLAYQYKLPKAIIPFIPQHHGTALMSYFYAKARDEAIAAAGSLPGTPAAEAAAATVDHARFRHVGPKPQSREAAILMLADSVEASVRSLTSHDEPAIRAMVVRIIRERLEDGQFDESDLTLRDIELIREAFVAQLIGMYHRRIEYPQNKVVELESRRAASGGGGEAS